MIFPKLPLTETAACINFASAARPKIAHCLTSHEPDLGFYSNYLGSDLLTKLILNLSSVIEIAHEFRHKNVCSQTDGVRRILSNKPTFRCILNPKKLNSGFFSLFHLALKQVARYRRVLRNRYMQNQISDPQTTTIRWVTVEKCAELIGWTKDAINALRVKGKIRMDVHWVKRNGRIFIDMAALQQWIGTGR